MNTINSYSIVAIKGNETKFYAWSGPSYTVDTPMHINAFTTNDLEFAQKELEYVKKLSDFNGFELKIVELGYRFI